jgi:hypothetical protein
MSRGITLEWRKDAPMAGFRMHVTVSSTLGLGYTAVLGHLGVDWIHSSLAGALCGIAGMLPDLDSDSGKPVREIFGVTAVMAPLLFFNRMDASGFTSEGKILLAAGVYIAVRFGLAWMFRRLTVHRGMFHSIPGAIIAAEVVFLAHDCPERFGRLILAGGVLLGYLSHLILDEIYAIDTKRLIPRANKSAGSAFKFFSQSIPATLCTWSMLGALTYIIGVEQGYFKPVQLPIKYAPAVMKTDPPKNAPSSVPGIAVPGR